MIADPVEETFPFTGHTEFVDVDSPARLRVGEAEAFRADYMRRLAAHRDAIARGGAGAGLDPRRCIGPTGRPPRRCSPCGCGSRPIWASIPFAAGTGRLMFGLPLAFTAPLVLAALAGLPLLYYLLRITPPRPRQVPFPPLRLISRPAPDETRRRVAPLWWLLLLRLAIAACIILAMAGPVLESAPRRATAAGPLLVVLDDGWPAAPSLARRASRRPAERIERGRTAFAPDRRRRDLGRRARDRRRPTPPRRSTGCARSSPCLHSPTAGRARRDPEIRRGPSAIADIVWIADGIEARPCARLREGRSRRSRSERSSRRSADPVRALAGAAKPSRPPSKCACCVAAYQGPATGRSARARPQGARRSARRLSISPARPRRKAKFDLPVELRNEIARLEIADEHSAGAVSLLDERWRRRRVGLVSGETADVVAAAAGARLLSRKGACALRRRARGTARRHRSGPRPARGPCRGDDPRRCRHGAGPRMTNCKHFVEDGGILLRFAGTRLAASSDDLVPVRLRRGGRVLGGAMSWETPKQLAPFERASPFFGLAVAGGSHRFAPGAGRAGSRPRRPRPGRSSPTARRS